MLSLVFWDNAGKEEAALGFATPRATHWWRQDTTMAHEPRLPLPSKEAASLMLLQASDVMSKIPISPEQCQFMDRKSISWLL